MAWSELPATGAKHKSNIYIHDLPAAGIGGSWRYRITAYNTSQVASTVSDATGDYSAAKVTGAVIAAQTIVAANIAANTITAACIAAATITAACIAANTIEAGNIKAGTITGTEISASTTISAGSGNDIAKLSGNDDTYRIWCGHATAASAPFSITKAGALKATSATIQTAVSGQRMILDSSDNTLRFYDSGGTEILYILATTNQPYLRLKYGNYYNELDKTLIYVGNTNNNKYAVFGISASDHPSMVLNNGSAIVVKLSADGGYCDVAANYRVGGVTVLSGQMTSQTTLEGVISQLKAVNLMAA